MNKTTAVTERTLDFTGETIYVGLDVHNKTWYATAYYANSLAKRFSCDGADGITSSLNSTYPNAEFKRLMKLDIAAMLHIAN